MRQRLASGAERARNREFEELCAGEQALAVTAAECGEQTIGYGMVDTAPCCPLCCA